MRALLLPSICCATLLALIPVWSISAGEQASAPVQFTNVIESAGIHWAHSKASNGISTILEEAGPGVCVADFDGDGFEDIYFVNGRDRYKRGIHLQNALYRNNGNGTFTDVTEKSGVPGTGYGLGCVWGDYDNDGHPDLYVTQYGKNVLYHNNGDGTFTDVTEKAHVDGTDFGTVFHSGATFFDYDRDGKLDLYVGGYANFTSKSQQHCTIGLGVVTSCLPAVYGGTPDVLYHNNHDGTFTETGLSSGMALTSDGATMAAMCTSLGDYDNDGLVDLYMSDFQLASDHLWHNDGKGFFQEVSESAGIREATRNVLSFGGGFFDYDNDGWLDLFIANGHVYEEVEQTAPGIHYKQINSLFHNERNGRFADVTKISGNGFTVPHAGRGAAFADFDNDGNIDVVVGNNNDPPLLLHNSGAPGRHFVTFHLAGVKSNRDAMGARVILEAGGLKQIREVAGGGSYLSQSDLRAHFGLGESTKVDSVEIRWPSGLRQLFHDIAADRFYEVEEGKNQLSPAPPSLGTRAITPLLPQSR